MARRRSLSRAVRTLPYQIGLCAFAAPPLLWSKGIGEFCDFAGTRAYRLAPTESTALDSFFALHYGDAHGLVWLRLGTIARRNATCDLDRFVRAALSRITKPFVLVTTDGDASVPTDLRADTVAALKASPRLVGWYSQNCDGSDPDIRPFPIGLDLHTPRAWTTPRQLVANLERVRKHAAPVQERRLRIFSDLNLSPTAARREAIEALHGCGHLDLAGARVSQTEIWRQYARYPFVLSAHGNGLDCHRTWELMLLGCIVVTKTSSLDPLYDGLPVVIVEDWREARDPDRLSRWVRRLAPLTEFGYVRDRLHPEAWLGALRRRIAKASGSGLS